MQAPNHPTLSTIAHAQKHLLDTVFCGSPIGFATDPQWEALREALWILRVAYCQVLSEMQAAN